VRNCFFVLSLFGATLQYFGFLPCSYLLLHVAWRYCTNLLNSWGVEVAKMGWQKLIMRKNFTSSHWLSPLNCLLDTGGFHAGSGVSRPPKKQLGVKSPLDTVALFRVFYSCGDGEIALICWRGGSEGFHAGSGVSRPRKNNLGVKSSDGGAEFSVPPWDTIK